MKQCFLPSIRESNFLSGFLDFAISVFICILLYIHIYVYKIIKTITPSLQPIQLKEHTCKQGHYGDIVPKLLMRSMLVGPSWQNSVAKMGTTVFLINTILDICEGCFSRVYISSPSIDVDNTWKPVRDYIRDHIKPNDRDKSCFDSDGPSEREQALNTQHQVIDYPKKKT